MLLAATARTSLRLPRRPPRSGLPPHSGGGSKSEATTQLQGLSSRSSLPRRTPSHLPPPPLFALYYSLISDLGEWMEHSGSAKQSRHQSHILRPVQLTRCSQA